MALTPRPKEPETDFVDPTKPPGRTRVPFGSARQKMAVEPRPGYHRHWFNDEPGRVDRALEAGYSHVTDVKTGENKKMVVGRYESGAPQTAYLMEVPQEWYDEDQAAEQALVNEREETIRRSGKPAEVSKSDASRYYGTAQGRETSITRK